MAIQDPASMSSLPKFPYKILTATILITIATLIWFAYFSFNTMNAFQSIVTRDFRAIELRGVIMRLDEVLTMSARMGVVTGDKRWEERYNHYDPILTNKINEAALIVPFSKLGISANTTNEANMRLVNMERESFRLAKEGNLTGAKEILFGHEYEAQKKIYAEGMTKYSDLLQQHAEARLNREIRNTYYSLILIFIDIIASIIAWMITYKSIARWRVALSNAMLQEVKYKKEIEAARDRLEQRVLERTMELETKNNELRDEISQREKAEEKAAELNSRLILAAKRAGMSEIATSVLHNIGNVLNSAKTSIGLLQDNVSKTDATDIATISDMLQENKDKLDDFLFNDVKGKLIPGYLMTIGKTIKKDHEINLHEVKSIKEHIQHIEDIVSVQRAISGVSGVKEKVYIPDIFETALQMCGDVFEKRNITIKKEIKNSPLVTTDKSKLLQIIVNLIQNAKDALSTTDCHIANKTIVLLVDVSGSDDDKKVTISVEDNGVGIKTENLVSIFSLGYTTKPTGHGFGLHSSALTAKELGGKLTVQSSGVNKGAVFSLTLPLDLSAKDSKRRVTDDTNA